jgi:AraC-like DNA-binding protein
VAKSQSTDRQDSTVGTVRIGTVAAIPKVLNELGFDPAAVFTEIGFDQSLFDNPDNVIPYALRSHLIQHCVNKTQCQHFGLLIGQHINASALGLVGFLMQQSPDVRTALNSLVRYAHLHVQGAVISLEEEAGYAFLGYSIYQPNIKALEQIEDGAVAAIFNILGKLCGPSWIPNDVLFSHSKPSDVHPYQNFFKAPLIFNAERNGILFSSKWLKQPILGADPDLRSYLQKQVEQIETRYGDHFVEQVRRVLHSSLLTQQAHADQIAALFSMHPRTLHRRLKAHGTSFHELADEGRFEIAQQLLENSTMELSQIAASLDYADASAFTRAFRRWSGTTPAQWREQRHGVDAQPELVTTENHSN